MGVPITSGAESSEPSLRHCKRLAESRKNVSISANTCLPAAALRVCNAAYPADTRVSDDILPSDLLKKVEGHKQVVISKKKILE